MKGANPPELSYSSFPTSPAPSLGAALAGWGQRDNKKRPGGVFTGCLQGSAWL